ncbi:hypothetical protein TNIN_419071 [Trichonephila inaurata madagascariensis]|uniref:Uncharacterized protein n=1 Tax=Trichonephila inaurata madagascariensis TaxID=2747483 RepID=A0A8X6Y0Z4_9ARAC|nr:hypothetical protein TNIN_419071 [Trichonephila inaurata madagascariensis]
MVIIRRIHSYFNRNSYLMACEDALCCHGCSGQASSKSVSEFYSGMNYNFQLLVRSTTPKSLIETASCLLYELVFKSCCSIEGVAYPTEYKM